MRKEHTLENLQQPQLQQKSEPGHAALPLNPIGFPLDLGSSSHTVALGILPSRFSRGLRFGPCRIVFRVLVDSSKKGCPVPSHVYPERRESDFDFENLQIKAPRQAS